MKRILCFGDSLTHGTMPVAEDAPATRYDETKRWTGILQAKLAGRAVVIEEGLPSRTIDKEDTRPGKVGRNGGAYLWPCIGSQVPLDVVVLWLGTNDTKDMFDVSAEDVATAHQQMVAKLQSMVAPDCKLIVLSPPQMNPDAPGAQGWYAHAQPKLAALPALYRQTAAELGVEYIDAYALLGQPAIPDGIHLSEAQNQLVADAVYDKLIEIGAV